jgi:hypothetical protein
LHRTSSIGRKAIARTRILTRYRWLAVALLMFIATSKAHAIILIVVFGSLTLFEIEGVTFTSYSTEGLPRLHLEDTSDGFMGDVDLHGQTTPRSDLTLVAVSASDPSQQVPIAIDVLPLLGPPHEGSICLESRPLPMDPAPTDRLLDPFLDPLQFEFRFVGQMPDPETGGTRSEYQLEQVIAPEPVTLELATLGMALCLCRRRFLRHETNTRKL